MKSDFIKYFENSIKEHWELMAMTDYVSKKSYTYQQVGEEILKLHILFKELNIAPNDKIALVGRNTPEWAITFIATITYGAVIVPILQDFHADDVQHIVNHSESKLLFLSDSHWENLNEKTFQTIRGVFSISDFRCLYQAPGETIQMTMKHLDQLCKSVYPNGVSKTDIKFVEKDDYEMSILNYTSGTTGFSKGVMLTGDNMCTQVEFAQKTDWVGKGYKILTFLPLAHAYGCAFDFVVQFVMGAHITFLTRIPSPKILLKAMEEIRPTVIFTVPLILEKIYKNSVLPALNKTSIKLATNIPFVNTRIYAEFRKKLVNALGGEFKTVIAGGAPLNKEVEDFLHLIKFPYVVGYGMTECAPLITVEMLGNYRPHSVGRAIHCVDMKIDSSDPQNVPGEILVKGRNVMIGYYKNEEATSKIFTEDGWLRTGDMGVIDKDGHLFIKGRSKTMILTSSGQNVYPEEIESKLNNLPFVSESLVIQRDTKIVALIYPDFAAMDEMGIQVAEIDKIMDEQRKELNKQLAAYENITKIIIHPQEFEKTPKKSIKRYLYENF
ncbi:MAG: AMP-binding protein [Paludibacteraceae bacterium]|jgi:long-chain acyl-CoA synthetase|nr:AMP-binding protein [Paludibacteraceae bacterium]